MPSWITKRTCAHSESLSASIDILAARERFQAGDYERVVDLLGSLQYPDLLEPSERTRLEIARRRAAR